MSIHTKIFGITVKAADVEQRSIDVVASTDALDSYNERVAQDWNLERYKKNPVVLWNHNRGAMFASNPEMAMPIGTAENVRIENGALQATLKFVTAEANPIAERVWQGLKQGSLRAVSVGFRSNDERAETRDGKEVWVLSQNELHEISVVPIPANPEAVATGKPRSLETSTTIPSDDAEKERKMSIERELAEAKAASEKALGLVAQEAAKVKALEAQNETLVKERDAAVARAAKAEDELVEREVAALVGVKLTPAEAPMFVELAKSNRPLFTKMVAQRSDLKLLGAPVISGTPGDEPKPVAGPDLDGILADIHKAVSA